MNRLAVPIPLSGARQRCAALAEAGECLRTSTASKFFHQVLAGTSNSVDAGIEGGGDFAVPPSFASLRGIALQQNACFGQLPTGAYRHVSAC
jgi:hypothetical protein